MCSVAGCLLLEFEHTYHVGLSRRFFMTLESIGVCNEMGLSSAIRQQCIIELRTVSISKLKALASTHRNSLQ